MKTGSIYINDQTFTHGPALIFNIVTVLRLGYLLYDEHILFYYIYGYGEIFIISLYHVEYLSKCFIDLNIFYCIYT